LADFYSFYIILIVLGVTAEMISLQRGQLDPKFQVEGSPHQPIFFLEN